ncbi:MAG: hypothetical protein RL272_599 [Candidatus Parcubacteria bacterium]|jgi:nitrite reductase/ring-hydroxylating ferredoxin subunit
MPKIPLGKITDVPPGRSKTYVAHGKKILVANVGGAIKAYENLCPHMGGAMRYDGKRLVCAWHGAQFDAETGNAKANIAEGSKLTPVTVTVDGDVLYFDTESIPKSPWASEF